MQTQDIVRIAEGIMADLGGGHTEAIYQNALHRQLVRLDPTCTMELVIPIIYKGDTLGTCRADIVTMTHIIELKALPRQQARVALQMRKYLRHLQEKDGKLRRGLVINFNQDTETLDWFEYPSTNPQSDDTTQEHSQDY